MHSRTAVGIAAALLLLLIASPTRAEREGGRTLRYADLCRRMTDLQRLAALPGPEERTRQFSSCHRASRYDAETDSYIAWHENGDDTWAIRNEDGRAILAEMDGPGVIWRVWSALPEAGRWGVRIDGEDEPLFLRPFRELFGPWLGLELPRMAYRAALGWNLYLPIPFQDSAEVFAEPGWGAFYHITYGLLPPGTRVEELTLPLSEEQRTALLAANRALANLGEDPAGVRPDAETMTATRTLRPGETLTVFALGGPAAITALRARLHEGGPAAEIALRELALSIRWDGEDSPAVWSPLGDFFGTGPGRNRYRSLPMGVTEEGMYSYWYMPFRSAEIRLTNDGPVARTVSLEVVTAPLEVPIERLGRFHAKWHRDTGRDPRRPLDWPILRVRGRGRFVGSMLHVWNPHGGWWGEGDEKIFVDGEGYPSFFGTGSEDYFGYAWANPEVFHRPYHNQTLANGNFGNVSVNRWHVVDSVPFREGIEVAIEKYQPGDPALGKGLDAAEARRLRGREPYTTYAATAYFYLAAGQADGYEPVPLSRRVDYYDTDLSWKLAKYLLPAAVEVPDAPGKVRLEFHPVNFLPAEAEITLRWQIDSESGWRIEPAERTLRLDGGHSGRWSFTATVDPARAYPAPRAEITLGTDEGETRGSVALPVGRRTIRAFRAAERPALDGSLDDPAWQQAKTYRGFIGANGTARPGPDTRVRVLWDEEKLYFAFECLEPTPSALKRNERGRDGMVYADDAVEVFIEPDDGSGRYGQFIVNSLGTIFDGANLADASMSNWNAARWKTWNADWSAAASLGEDRWVCEMAVPLSSLTDRPPQPGDRWGFNAARDRYGDLPRPQYSSFTAMPVFFHLPAHFGELIFVGACE